MAEEGFLNSRIAAIRPSITLGITSRAKQMAAEGREVFTFAAGEPDFDTPNHIKAAAVKALDQAATKYAPVSGIPALRTAIADKLSKDNGLPYKPSQIVISNGAKHSLFNIFMAICREGDEVIIPAPYWLSYPEMVRVAGGKPVAVDCSVENSLKLTQQGLEGAITNRTKAVIINSPSNPTGVVYNGAELKALAEVAVANNIYIVSDEIYEKLLYDGATHVSPGSISSGIFERTITVNGFSKAYAMTGWRLGYFAGPAEIVAAAGALQSHSTSGANTFAQHGALEALSGPQDCVGEMLAAFAERRSYIYDRLLAIKGVECVKPLGAFYVFPDISTFGMGSIEFAERLLEAEGVAVVPGKPFGADRNVRLSYACSMEQIKDGMDKFEQFVSG